MKLTPDFIWFIAGVVFLIAEFLTPGFILIFFAAGSLVAAIFAGLMDINITIQVFIFIVSSLILLFTLRKYALRTFKGTTHTNIDAICTDSKIGKTAIVTKTIFPGKPGEIKIMGSFWMAVADMKIEKGLSVIVKNQMPENALILKVQKFEDLRTPLESEGAADN